jgi:hypothetical protein
MDSNCSLEGDRIYASEASTRAAICSAGALSLLAAASSSGGIFAAAAAAVICAVAAGTPIDARSAALATELIGEAAAIDAAAPTALSAERISPFGSADAAVRAEAVSLADNIAATVGVDAGTLAATTATGVDAAALPFAWKHCRHRTGRPCVGLKGTVVCTPHSEHSVRVSVRDRPAAAGPVP